MAAPKGNQFYKLALDNIGRNLTYETANELLQAAARYFEWCEENPLIKEKAFCSQGEVVTHDEEIVRPYTLHGLVVHLGISNDTWYRYCKNEDFQDICEIIQSIIRDQKFAGASVGIYNANIIARDLGLKDGETHVTVNNTTNPEQAMKDKGIPIPDMGDVEDVIDGDKVEGDDDDN